MTATKASALIDSDEEGEKPGSRARYTPLLPRPPEVSRWRAVGYSRFVSLMKVLLPAVAFVLLLLVAAWPYLDRMDNSFRIGFAALKARDVSSPRMVNPRYVGLDKNHRPFAVTADLATDETGSAAVVALEMPKADITLDDGSWLVLTSEAGVYSRDAQNLALAGDVTLYHDSGYEIRTAAADVDLAGGNASGNEPVAGHGPFGDLRSEGFRLSDKGKVITFTGKAQLVLYPGAGEAVR
jgi:lipopolysaccharide export system protein LptC